MHYHDVSLIKDDTLSTFTLQWQVQGRDTERQVQEKLLQDVFEHCRQYQEQEAYQEFRKLIITQPVLRDRFIKPKHSEASSLTDVIPWLLADRISDRPYRLKVCYGKSVSTALLINYFSANKF